jgi:hypothetical protein
LLVAHKLIPHYFSSNKWYQSLFLIVWHAQYKLLTSISSFDKRQLWNLVYSYENLTRFPWCVVNSWKRFWGIVEGVTLTSFKREVVQKIQRNDQQAFTIIHQCLDDATFDIVANTTIAKQAWNFLQYSNQGDDNVRKVCL